MFFNRFKNYLNKINYLKVNSFQEFQILDWKYTSLVHFDKKEINNNIKNNDLDILNLKKIFLLRIDYWLEKIEDLKIEINRNKKLNDYEIKILLNELGIEKDKYVFIRNTFDIELYKYDKNLFNKINNDNQILNKINDINYLDLSWKLYDLDKSYLDKIKKIDIKNIKNDNKESLNLLIKKDQLIELLNYAKKHLPNSFSFDISNKYWNLSHSNGIIKIPSKEEYSLRFIITLFFHEITHFFRFYNWIKNLKLNFVFSDYYTLEEWIALYNEYLYWNKIINIWEYIPIYDILYNILLDKNLNDIEKSISFANTLIDLKWFSIKTCDLYFKRFHRYTLYWSNKFLFKEIIYNKWLENVKKLINNDKSNYYKIMKGKIWISFFDKNNDWSKIYENIFNKKSFFKIFKQEDGKMEEKFFNKMIWEIKKVFNI